MFGGGEKFRGPWQCFRLGQGALLFVAAICKSQAFVLPSCEPASPAVATLRVGLLDSDGCGTRNAGLLGVALCVCVCVCV